MQEMETKTKYVFLVNHRITLRKCWFPDTGRGPGLPAGLPREGGLGPPCNLPCASPNSVRSPAAGVAPQPISQRDFSFFVFIIATFI